MVAVTTKSEIEELARSHVTKVEISDDCREIVIVKSCGDKFTLRSFCRIEVIKSVDKQQREKQSYILD